ncbi:MAG: DNA repair protein RecO [Deltaproteobacteria bacterium]|nr:DNA repair protein RecO [Deltaproteobacteria bacterium]
MRTVKESVFVVTSIPYKESDLIVNFLSRTNGKITSRILRGRRTGKDSSFLYQPGDLIEIEYQKKQTDDFVRVLNTQHLKLLKSRDFSYERFIFQGFILELIQKTSQPYDEAPELFDILIENLSLKWIDSEKFRFIAWSLWKVIRHGGFGINIHQCAKCGLKSWRLDSNSRVQFRKDKYQLHRSDGSVLCENCHIENKKASILMPTEIKVLWLMEQFPEFTSLDPDIPAEILLNLIPVLNDYLIGCFELRLKSQPLFLSTFLSIKNQPT